MYVDAAYKKNGVLDYSCLYKLVTLGCWIEKKMYVHEKSKIPFSYMLYAYSVKRAYRGTKPKESFG